MNKSILRKSLLLKRSKVKNRLVNKRYRKSMNIINFQYSKPEKAKAFGLFNTFDASVKDFT